MAPFGEQITGQPPVEDACRVVHLAVPEDVHRGLAEPIGRVGLRVGHGALVASRAARAAWGSASAMRAEVSSSCAALAHQTSDADGGRCTARASNVWTNAPCCAEWV